MRFLPVFYGLFVLGSYCSTISYVTLFSNKTLYCFAFHLVIVLFTPLLVSHRLPCFAHTVLSGVLCVEHSTPGIY
jgi:hypothetical protein